MRRIVRLPRVGVFASSRCATSPGYTYRYQFDQPMNRTAKVSVANNDEDEDDISNDIAVSHAKEHPIGCRRRHRRGSLDALGSETQPREPISHSHPQLGSNWSVWRKGAKPTRDS